MQSKALEILVGFFFALGVAAIFILTFRVASLDSVGADRGYRLTAKFENIGGLKVGSPVTMAGVRVGRVRDIRVDQELFEAVVSLEIAQQYDKIPDDSDAQILTAGLLGEQYIGLNSGGAEQYLKDGGEIRFTQSALVLENIIGQFAVKMVEGSGSQQGTEVPPAESQAQPSAPKPAPSKAP